MALNAQKEERKVLIIVTGGNMVMVSCFFLRFILLDKQKKDSKQKNVKLNTKKGASSKRNGRLAKQISKRQRF